MLFLLCYALIINPISCSIPPAWTTESKIQAGIKVIVENTMHQQSTDEYIYPYSPAYTTDPYTALGIIGFETLNLEEQNIKFKINVHNFMSTTELTIKMTKFTETLWQSFRISYIAIDKLFNMIQVDYFHQDDPPNVGTSIGKREYFGDFVLHAENLNMDHQISVMPFLVGVDMHSVNGEHCLNWETTIKDKNSIRYKLTADRTTQIYSITSYLIIIDQTQISFGQEKYFNDVYLIGIENTPNTNVQVHSEPINMHAGINSFSFLLFSFHFDKDTLELTTGGYYNHLNITILGYAERVCSDLTMPYYEQSSNLCYTACPLGFANLIGTTKKYCKPCNDLIFGCKTCSSDGLICTQSIGNYVIIEPENTSVICPNGFFQSPLEEDPALRCQSCHFSCQTCFGPLSTNCQTCSAQQQRTYHIDNSCPCDHGSKLNGECLQPCGKPGCQKCDINLNQCQSCSQDFVLYGSECKCKTNKYYNVSMSSCLPCHNSCQSCSGPGSNQCLSCSGQEKRQLKNSKCPCIFNYEESNGICIKSFKNSCEKNGYQLDQILHECVEICGDGIPINHECDDGNRKNWDGCSENCQIQEGYICNNNNMAPTSRSYCSYKGQFTFTLVETTKQIYSNQLNFIFLVGPTLHINAQIFQNSIYQIQFESEGKTIKIDFVEYDRITRLLHVSVLPDSSLHSKYIQMVFKPANYPQSFAILDTFYRFLVEPQNNLVAINYSQQIYGKLHAHKVISMSIAIIGLVLVPILLFYRKMIALEFIMMIQLLYQGSILTEYTHPFMAPFHEIHYCNGLYGIKLDDKAMAGFPFKTLGYHAFFSLNYSILLITLLALYLGALIKFIETKMIKSKKAQEQRKKYQLLIEGSFGLVFFSINGIVSSLIVSIQSENISNFSIIQDKAIFLIIAIIIVLHIIYFISMVHDSKDSSYFYHPDKNYAHFYPLLFIAKNTIVTAFIFFRPDLQQLSSILCVTFSTLYILAVFIGRPYKNRIDHMRFGCIEVTLLFFWIYQLIQEQKIITLEQLENNYLASFFTGSIIAILCGIFGSILLTISSVINHLSITYKQSKQHKQINDKPRSIRTQDKILIDYSECTVQVIEEDHLKNTEEPKKRKRNMAKVDKTEQTNGNMTAEEFVVDIESIQGICEQEIKVEIQPVLKEDDFKFLNAGRLRRRRKKQKKELPKRENESMHKINDKSLEFGIIWADEPEK